MWCFRGALSQNVKVKKICFQSLGLFENLELHLLKCSPSATLHYQVLRRSSKAAFCHNIGEPLKVEDVKDQKLKKGEVKIKVKYCGLNPRDLLLLQGKLVAKTPFIPGFEVSGEVVEKHKDSDSESEIEVGDKVVALTKSSLSGLSSLCIAQEKDVWKYNTLDSKVAAGLIVNYGHALLSLFRRAKIKKNNTLLITVESGGLGLAALDIAANVYKAKVVAVCGSEEKADILREKGAWSAVKMDLSNLKASVGDVTEGQGIDVVYETVGGDYFKGAMQCVKHEGLLILADLFSSEDSLKLEELLNLHTFNMTALTLDQYREHNFPVYRQAISDVIELCEQNLISPHLSKSFDLENVNEAVKILMEDQTIGKILIKLPK